MKLPANLIDLLHQASPCYVTTLMPDGSPQMTQTRVGTDGERVVINPVQGQRYLGAPCPWYGGRDQA